MDAWLLGLEASALARLLRNSVWLYPLVNAGHLLGIALLVGAIVPLDLRLLGGWRKVPLAPLWAVLVPTAATGLVLAVVFGALLFVARASEYAASPLFLAKMAGVALGAGNALLLHLVSGRRARTEEAAGAHARAAAVASLTLWLAVVVAGRWIGYL